MGLAPARMLSRAYTNKMVVIPRVMHCSERVRGPELRAAAAEGSPLPFGARVGASSGKLTFGVSAETSGSEISLLAA